MGNQQLVLAVLPTACCLIRLGVSGLVYCLCQNRPNTLTSRLLFILPCLLALVQPKSATPTPADPFLHRLYDQLHDSPTQQAYRKLAPMPAGVVYGVNVLPFSCVGAIVYRLAAPTVDH